MASAHAAVLALEKWRDHPDTQEWLPNFRKVVVKVTDKQFEKAKTYNKECIAYTDEDDYGPEEMVLIFRPSRQWNEFFKSLPLYK